MRVTLQPGHRGLACRPTTGLKRSLAGEKSRSGAKASVLPNICQPKNKPMVRRGGQRSTLLEYKISSLGSVFSTTDIEFLFTSRGVRVLHLPPLPTRALKSRACSREHRALQLAYPPRQQDRGPAETLTQKGLAGYGLFVTRKASIIRRNILTSPQSIRIP